MFLFQLAVRLNFNTNFVFSRQIPFIQISYSASRVDDFYHVKYRIQIQNSVTQLELSRTIHSDYFHTVTKKKTVLYQRPQITLKKKTHIHVSREWTNYSEINTVTCETSV